ncbi:MAG TPA: hypothetical protein VJ821_00705 [Anaerolineales bacterium]|nr:hypothetical protein [Anaerolineales bacterium]
MERSARAPGYDLFKLLVALILFILFLLLFRNQAPQTAIPQSDAPTFTVLPPGSTGLSTPASETAISSPSAISILGMATGPTSSTPTGTVSSGSSTTLGASPTSVSARSSPEATPTPMLSTATSTSLPSPTQTAAPPTNTQVMSVTPLSPPSPTPVIESPATPTADAPPSADVCDAASARSRLRVGMNATILRRLNFRSSPGIRDNWILTNIPGTPVEVVGGPECVPHLWGAYLWWQIRLTEGQIGWSAEGSLHGTFYFMEPE